MLFRSDESGVGEGGAGNAVVIRHVRPCQGQAHDEAVPQGDAVHMDHVLPENQPQNHKGHDEAKGIEGHGRQVVQADIRQIIAGAPEKSGHHQQQVGAALLVHVCVLSYRKSSLTSHYTTDHPARKQLFSLFRLFPQPHIALVMELLDEQQRHRQQDHARHAEGPEAGVHSRQRRQGGEARLGGHDLGLQKAAHSGDHRIQRRKSHRPGGLPQQQARRCPGQQHRPRAEHRQGVHQRSNGGQQQGVSLAHQQKARQQLTERDPQQNGLGPEPFPQGGQEIRLDTPGPVQPRPQLAAEEGHDPGIAAGSEEHRQGRGAAEQEHPGQSRRQGPRRCNARPAGPLRQHRRLGPQQGGDLLQMR